MEQKQQIQEAAGSNRDVNALRHYWHVCLERRWLIVALFSLFVVLGVVYALRATPIYEAVVRLQIDPETSGVLSVRDVVNYGGKDTDYLQTQYRNLLSRTLIELVKQNLKLDEDERYKKKVDQALAISKDITVVPIRLTRLVEVRVEHPVAKRAEDIANTLVDTFLTQNQDRKMLKASEGYTLLKKEAASQEIELQNTIENLQKFRSDRGMVSLVDDRQQQDNVDSYGLRQAHSDVQIAQNRSASAEQQAKEAERWVKGGNEVADLGVISQDKLVGELKSRITQEESQLRGLHTKYRDRHPKVIELNEMIAADKNKLKNEAMRTFDSILSMARTAKAEEEQAQRRYKEAEDKVTKLYEAKTTFDILSRKRERAEVIYQLVLQKTKEYDMNSKDHQQNMSIIDRATTPLKAVKPNKPLVISGSVFGGLAIAFGLAIFVNFLDDSIKSQEDVENYLRLPFLGYIPNIKSQSVVERDLQSHLHPTSSAAEGFRTLRAAVSLARNADKLRNIAITSTIPSEGKSLVASNFAIVTAQTGLRTLLVDADLRRPSVHKAFQLQSPIGLSAYLAERVRSIDEIVHTTEVPNLDVVCCGVTPGNPSELISSKRMLQFLEEAGTRYDRVVLDCPPVSAVADPLVVGAISDGIMFVTKFNKIRREHALRSVQRVQDAGIHMLGLVLNDIDFEGKDSYYYSYHYYQNRYYSSHYRSSGAAAVANAATAAKKESAKS